MPTRTEPKAIASRCLAAWSSGDLDTTRSLLHDDVVFTGPLGATEGADAYIEGIQAMIKIVERAEQPAARIPTAGWYRVRDGKIASVRAFFDPRPLTSAS